jgi:hypothetical protein
MTDCSTDYPTQRRVKELVDDGYIVISRGHVIVTAKGWRCLAACAERPMKPPLSPRLRTRHDIVDR